MLMWGNVYVKSVELYYYYAYASVYTFAVFLFKAHTVLYLGSLRLFVDFANLESFEF